MVAALILLCARGCHALTKRCIVTRPMTATFGGGIAMELLGAVQTQSAVYHDPFTTHHSRSRLAEIAASRTGELVEPPATTPSASAEAVDPCKRRPFDWLSRQFCFAGRLYCEAETCHWRYPSPTYRYTRRLSLLFPRLRARWSMQRVFT
ncbi:hypothetical protein CI102_1049 [Trichoderma harzianum]|nr:hypothetical protein CI102_1049 [Trichoderma harzianum]